ncbi:MAG: MMPL family transporter, partial [Thermoplasmata archaeon]|nr:MMPL family transporter [Thermoplasmata archaeon]
MTASPGPRAARKPPAGLFERLGRWIVRHPWYPVVFWILLLVVSLPFLSRLAEVSTNSATTLPSSAPSAVAQAEIARLFPGHTAGTESLLLLTGAHITGPVGQASVVALSLSISNDSSIRYLKGVETLYSAYSAYLVGMAELAGGVIGPGLSGPRSVLPEVNSSNELLWGPPALFLSDWNSYGAHHSGTPAISWNAPARASAAATLAGNQSELDVLAAFYDGAQGSGAGFNGSADCAAAPSTVVACVDSTARSQLSGLLSIVAPSPAWLPALRLSLSDVGVENYTLAGSLRTVALELLAEGSGLSFRWLDVVETEFPGGSVGALAALLWAVDVADHTPVAQYPLPVPPAVSHTFVDASGDATILIVTFSVESGYTDPSGGTPVLSDVDRLDALGPSVLSETDPGRTIDFVQTGPAALDQQENTDLNSSLAIVLPLTVLVLVLITSLYFRAPLAPALTFGALGIAIVLGLAGVVLIGTFVTHVDQTSRTLENTFVLGVGTDYSIFLVARYREELSRGADHEQAVVTTVAWAGQSIGTSGATAILATLALSFSGVALLSQWGYVLSLAVLITLLVSLTLVPALLTLVGPRVFWPSTGERFRRAGVKAEERHASQATYFYRVGRAVQRRPKSVVALVLLASVPLVYVALTAPISYDFYGQLPSGHGATQGLSDLGQHFGSGFAFPMSVLVTFASPLSANGSLNSSELTELSGLSSVMGNVSGVAVVDSPMGPYGPPLSRYLAYPTLGAVNLSLLGATLSHYVGTDGRTVELTVLSTTSGLSSASVSMLSHLKTAVAGYEGSHPDIRSVAYGGGTSETADIGAATAIATERMAILVSIGLLIVLFAVLRSYLIAVLAVATIGLSIGWAWGTTNLVLGDLFGLPLFYFAPTVLFILILGLGIDYNIFLLTRV